VLFGRLQLSGRRLSGRDSPWQVVQRPTATNRRGGRVSEEEARWGRVERHKKGHQLGHEQGEWHTDWHGHWRSLVESGLSGVSWRRSLGRAPVQNRGLGGTVALTVEPMRQ
jgi:hypothetical protein